MKYSFVLRTLRGRWLSLQLTLANYLAWMGCALISHRIWKSYKCLFKAHLPQLLTSELVCSTLIITSGNLCSEMWAVVVIHFSYVLDLCELKKYWTHVYDAWPGFLGVGHPCGWWEKKQNLSPAKHENEPHWSYFIHGRLNTLWLAAWASLFASMIGTMNKSALYQLLVARVDVLITVIHSAWRFFYVSRISRCESC